MCMAERDNFLAPFFGGIVKGTGPEKCFSKNVNRLPGLMFKPAYFFFHKYTNSFLTLSITSSFRSGPKAVISTLNNLINSAPQKSRNRVVVLFLFKEQATISAKTFIIKVPSGKVSLPRESLKSSVKGCAVLNGLIYAPESHIFQLASVIPVIKLIEQLISALKPKISIYLGIFGIILRANSLALIRP